MKNDKRVQERNFLEKMIKDVLTDLSFLSEKMHMTKILETLGPENICWIPPDRYFMSDWSRYLLVKIEMNQFSTQSVSTSNSQQSKGQHPANEDLQKIASTILKLKGYNESVTDLKGMKLLSTPQHRDLLLTAILKSCFSENEDLRKLMKSFLNLTEKKNPRYPSH
jgi:hypothetical protein